MTLTAADIVLLHRIAAGDVIYRANILGRCSYRLHPEARLVTPQCKRFHADGLTGRVQATYYAHHGTVTLTTRGRDALALAMEAS